MIEQGLIDYYVSSRLYGFKVLTRFGRSQHEALDTNFKPSMVRLIKGLTRRYKGNAFMMMSAGWENSASLKLFLSPGGNVCVTFMWTCSLYFFIFKEPL